MSATLQAHVFVKAKGNTVTKTYSQSPEQLLAGQVMAVAYSGFRTGQHPDRGHGAINPSDEEVLEDLQLLVEHQFSLIRLYDAGENSADVLRLIRQHQLPIKVMLGIWLEAELSNHLACEWLNEPIAQQKLDANKLVNQKELARGVALATQYEDIVMAVNVGNEALVEWNDHLVSLDAIIAYVKQMKSAIKQPVTVADNCEWWINDGAPLAEVVDFLGVHTYPAWENIPIEQALDYTIDSIERVHRALPDKPIAILEGGWASTANEFGGANEDNQARYYVEVAEWARQTHTTFMFFEAFDEPWKGSPDNLNGAEKHWGLFFEDRTPKKVVHVLHQ